MGQDTCVEDYVERPNSPLDLHTLGLNTRIVRVDKKGQFKCHLKVLDREDPVRYHCCLKSRRADLVAIRYEPIVSLNIAFHTCLILDLEQHRKSDLGKSRYEVECHHNHDKLWLFQLPIEPKEDDQEDNLDGTVQVVCQVTYQKAG